MSLSPRANDANPTPSPIHNANSFAHRDLQSKGKRISSTEPRAGGFFLGLWLARIFMNRMKHGFCIFLAWVGLSLSSHAQVPPAEQLLPEDAFGVFTIPDWIKLCQAQVQSAQGQLWADVAMKPFRDNLSSNLQNDFLKPLEKQLGVSLDSYKELLQGQVTIAVLPPKEGTSEFASFLLMLDSKDKSDLLTAKLAEFKKKWTESGKEIRTEKIRDTEFSTIAFSKADVEAVLQKAFPSGDADSAEKSESTEKIELRVGQFKSLLIIGQGEKAIEKVLARQSGGLVAPLADQISYQKSHALLFRDSLAHGWINIKPIYEKVLKLASQEEEGEEPPPGMPAMKLDKILPALGLASLESVAAKMSSTPEGTAFGFFASVPEARREGIFKLLTLEKKDAAPPAFVPADVTAFQRTRVDSQRAWDTLETTLGKIDPSLAGLVKLMLSSAGKDQDPNFDLKKNLIGNLGDDFIQYQKAPKGATPAELSATRALVLVGSPNAPALVNAIRTITSLLPPPMSSAPLQEREFLGRKIYSLSMAMPAAEPSEEDSAAAGVAQQTLSFTASGGYVAFSTDTPLLEEYLRSGENPPKPLRSVAGLMEATQKVGGMENGYFSYDNQAESLRMTLEALKTDPEGFSKMLFFAFSRGNDDGQDTFNRFFNLKLLPSFDRISKYLGFAIASGTTTPDGFVVKAYGPRPPGLAK
jgi:hypothetical protein